MNNTLLQNMQEKCRVCLVTIDAVVRSGVVENGIEESKVIRNNLLSPDLCRLFLSFTTLDVRYELEEFPKHLCQQCVEKLNEFDEFREKALASTRVLYLSLKNSATTGDGEIQQFKKEQSYNDCSFEPNQMCAAIMDTTSCNDENEYEGDENVCSSDQDSNADNGEIKIEINDENLDNDGNNDDDRGGNSRIDSHPMSSADDSSSENSDSQNCEGNQSEAGTAKVVNVYNEGNKEDESESESETSGNNRMDSHPMSSADDSSSENSDSQNCEGNQSEAGTAKVVNVYNEGNKEDESETSGNNRMNSHPTSPVYDRSSESRNSPDCALNKDNNSDAGTTKVVPPKKIKLYCFICKRQFRREEYYNAHMLQVHQGVEKPFSCDKCCTSFKSLCQLTYHKDVDCGKTNTLLKDNIPYKMIKQRGRKHEKSITEFVCEICKRYLSTKRALFLHMERHKQSARHKCPECDVVKVTANEITLHVQRVHHKNLQKFKCPQCPQLFAFKNVIPRHIRAVHEGIRNYVCSHCPKRFSTHTAQLLHETNTHAKGRYLCNICYRSFPIEATFNKHLKKHARISCNLCPKLFGNLKTLADHQKVHLGDNPQVCTVCSHGFYNVLDLKLHMEQQHVDDNCNEGGAEKQTVTCSETTEGPFVEEGTQANITKSKKKRKAVAKLNASEENEAEDKKTTQGTKKSCKGKTSKPLSVVNNANKPGSRSSARKSNTKK